MYCRQCGLVRAPGFSLVYVCSFKCMLNIVSWNVASWPTSCVQLRGTDGGPTPLRNFLDSLHGDIVCIQETKVALKRLTLEPYVKGATDHNVGVPTPIEGYESYWASNTLPKGSGFNGVCTFAKVGDTHRVVFADGCPLRIPEDAEGRCMFTVHVLVDPSDSSRYLWIGVFNVYAPFSPPGDAPRQEKKRCFLEALRGAMERAAAGDWLPSKAACCPPLSIILCGDLNLHFAPSDSHWSKRVMDVDVVSAAIKGTASHVQQVPMYVKSLTQCLHSYLTKTLSVKESLDPLAVIGLLDEYKARFGQWLFVRDIAQGTNFSSLDVSGSAGPGGPLVTAHAHLVAALQGLVVEDLPTSRNQALALFALMYGRPTSNPTHLKILSQLVVPYITPRSSGLCLVDAFRLCYPKSQGAYTCWDQSINGRGENVGSRLDYIFVDVRLGGTDISAYSPRTGSELDGYEPPLSTQPSPYGLKRERDSEGSPPEVVADVLRSMRNVTNGGGTYAQSPLTGGGMRPLNAADLRVMVESSRPPNSTCFIYTPPQLSDHIAIRTAVTIRADAPWVTVDPNSLQTHLRQNRQQYQYRHTTPGIVAFFQRKPSTTSREEPITIE